MTGRRWAGAMAAALLALAAGIYFGAWHRSVPAGPSPASIEAFYAASLPDLAATPQRMAQWKDRILVVNFWATWCEPCREEIPGLIRSQSKSSSKNVQIVGIALDSADKVAAFAKSAGINYPVLIGGLDGFKLAELLGNRSGALPYTIVIAPQGQQARGHLGMVREALLEQLITEIGTATRP